MSFVRQAGKDCYNIEELTRIAFGPPEPFLLDQKWMEERREHYLREVEEEHTELQKRRAEYKKEKVITRSQTQI